MKHFDKYVKKNFDMQDYNINYKYYHSYRVMKLMLKLSKNLKLNSKDTHLAKVIGLLHDIGRFDQEKIFNSFRDEHMDHGDYGSKILKEKNILRYYNIDDSDYDVVYKAVKNHNKACIEKNLNDRELLFAKMIRDADKTDILYALGNKKIKVLRQDETAINQELIKDFYNNKPLRFCNVKSKNDVILIFFSFIYDLNFIYSLRTIYKRNYYEKIYDKIIKKDNFKKILDYTNIYIRERIKQNDR